MHAHGQSSNDQSEGNSSFFANANGGFGMLYGGFGGNIEAGIGHFSGFVSVGYATARIYDTVTIQPSLNYQFGLRYYFDVGSDVLFPRVGIGYGWVTNYYDERLAGLDYDQHVEGISLHIGVQFYSMEGVVFNFDVGMSSKYAISQGDQHPFFYPLYVRPNVGIGYDLVRLFGKTRSGTRVLTARPIKRG
jgi:hypothetical protein